MDVLMTSLGVVAAYTGCVLLFQSGARRQRHKAVRIAKDQRALFQIAGWMLVAASLAVLWISHGGEMGVTFWLAALALAGIASLLVSALVPRLHLASPLAVAVICVAFATSFTVLGSPA